MNIKLLNELNDIANKIYKSNLDWEQKYDLIFSDSLSKVVFNEIYIDYYDPDTSYKEDITAFVNAFNEKMKQLNTIFKEGYWYGKL